MKIEIHKDGICDHLYINGKYISCDEPEKIKRKVRILLSMFENGCGEVELKIKGKD